MLDAKTLNDMQTNVRKTKANCCLELVFNTDTGFVVLMSWVRKKNSSLLFILTPLLTARLSQLALE